MSIKSCFNNIDWGICRTRGRRWKISL